MNISRPGRFKIFKIFGDINGIKTIINRKEETELTEWLLNNGWNVSTHADITMQK